MRKRLINRLWLALVLLPLIVLEAKAEEIWLENNCKNYTKRQVMKGKKGI